MWWLFKFRSKLRNKDWRRRRNCSFRHSTKRKNLDESLSRCSSSNADTCTRGSKRWRRKSCTTQRGRQFSLISSKSKRWWIPICSRKRQHLLLLKWRESMDNLKMGFSPRWQVSSQVKQRKFKKIGTEVL